MSFSICISVIFILFVVIICACILKYYYSKIMISVQMQKRISILERRTENIMNRYKILENRMENLQKSTHTSGCPHLKKDFEELDNRFGFLCGDMRTIEMRLSRLEGFKFGSVD